MVNVIGNGQWGAQVQMLKKDVCGSHVPGNRGEGLHLTILTSAMN